MKLKRLFERNITLKYYEIKGIVIITLLSTLFLLNIWPRFRADVLEFRWYWYIILIALLLVIWRVWKKRSG